MYMFKTQTQNKSGKVKPFKSVKIFFPERQKVIKILFKN